VILGRERVLKLVREKKLIENFDEMCLEGAGYDLHAAYFYRIGGGAKLSKDERKLPDIEEIKVNVYTLQPGEYVLIRTLEKVNMPDDIGAFVTNRSTLLRSGVTTINAFVDPGFKGTLTFGLKNLSNHAFTLEKGARVVQIIFEKVGGGTKPYGGRYQGGKVT
jgi:deoxycytidine triphosphate deaminase